MRAARVVVATLLLAAAAGAPAQWSVIAPSAVRAASVQTGKIVYTLNSNEIWVAERDGRNAHHVADGNNPVFSPDGLRIAYAAADPTGIDTFIYSSSVDGGGRVRESGPLVDPPPPPVNTAGPYDLYNHAFPRYSPDGQGIFYFGMEQHYDGDGNCATDWEGFARSSGDGADTRLKGFWTSCNSRPDDVCFPAGASAQDFSLGGPWPAPGADAAALAYDLTCVNDPSTPLTAQLLRGDTSTPLLAGAEIAGGWTADGRILLDRTDADGVHDYLVTPSGQATRLGLPNPLFGTATTGCTTLLSTEPLGAVFSPDGKVLGWSQGADPSLDAPSPACTDRHAGIWLAGLDGSNPHQVVEGETAVLHDIQCTPGNCLTGIIITKAFGPTTTPQAFPARFTYSGAANATRTWRADPFHPPFTDPLLVRLTPGTYTISEAEPAGWASTGVQCDGVAVTKLGAGSISVTIAADSPIATCTFTSDWDGVTPPSEIETAAAPTAAPGCTADGDSDGFCDGIEAVYDSDPGDAASTPVVPDGYWDQPGHGKLGPVPQRRCDPGNTKIDPCALQPGDVLVTRHDDNKDVQNLVERFLGDTYWTHSLLFIGFFELGPYNKGEIVPVVLDITPAPTGRSEMALSDWNPTFVNVGDNSEAVRAYRSRSMSRVERELAARNGLGTALRLGAASSSNHDKSFWNAPDAGYAHTPDGWGPSRFYCSSLVSSSYGFGYSDFHGLLDLASLAYGAAANAYVTPDDMLDGLPDMHWVLDGGLAVGYGSDGRGFSMWSPANLLLTNPAGQRSGRDGAGVEYDEIEGANWRLLAGDEGQVPTESVTAPGVGDDWIVTVSGTGSGEYHLVSHAMGDDVGARIVRAGTTSPGKVETFTVGQLFAGVPGTPAANATNPMVLLLIVALVVVAVVVIATFLVRRRRGTRSPAS